VSNKVLRRANRKDFDSAATENIENTGECDTAPQRNDWECLSPNTRKCGRHDVSFGMQVNAESLGRERRSSVVYGQTPASSVTYSSRKSQKRVSLVTTNGSEVTRRRTKTGLGAREVRFKSLGLLTARSQRARSPTRLMGRQNLADNQVHFLGFGAQSFSNS
jgi:hypothetical protein